MKAYVVLFREWDNYTRRCIGIFSSPQAARNALDERKNTGRGTGEIVRYDCSGGWDGEISVKTFRPNKAEPRIFYAVVSNEDVIAVYQYMGHAKETFNYMRKYVGITRLQTWEDGSLLTEYAITNPVKGVSWREWFD